MRRRMLSGLMAGVMTLSLLTGVSAAKTVPEAEAVEVISALNIMVGDEKGDMGLGRQVNRAEFTTMAVKASPQRDQVGKASTSPYPDVPRNHWSAAYVEAAVRMGLISGYLDGTFKPGNRITLGEGCSIALKLLGYTSGDFVGSFPTAQISLAHSLHLDENLSAQNASDILNRRDAMYLFYNLLSAKTKSGQYYLNTLGYAVGPDGEVDRVALLGQVMEGPIVAGDDWQSRVGFPMEGAQIRRAGKPSEPASIQSGDILYYNEGMHTVWAYTDRVTGTVQAVAPSGANPSSVTVAGRTYPIESADAAYALSDLGGYRLGDTVTLALGRTGGVAAVLKPSVGEQNKVGIVTAVSKGSYSSSNGSSYTADTVTLQATDGRVYSYQWDTRYFDVGDLVQVRVAGDGGVELKRIQEEHLTGKVSDEGDAIGAYPFAENIEIMDTYKNTGIRVFPGRLAGVSMTDDMVRYYSLDPQGRIEKLILDEVTGDMHQYGVMTRVLDSSGYMHIQVSYTMDLGGQSVTFPSQGKKYPVDVGPMVLKGTLGEKDMVLGQLKQRTVDSIHNNIIRSGPISFEILDSTLIYEVKDGEYYLSNLQRVNDGNHTLTVWYDKQPSQGGGVRVLLAKAK